MYSNVDVVGYVAWQAFQRTGKTRSGDVYEVLDTCSVPDCKGGTEKSYTNAVLRREVDIPLGQEWIQPPLKEGQNDHDRDRV